MKTLTASILMFCTPAIADVQQYHFSAIDIQPGYMAVSEHDPQDVQVLYFNNTTANGQDSTSWFISLAPGDDINIVTSSGEEDYIATDIGELFHSATRWGTISVQWVGGDPLNWPFAEGQQVSVESTPEPSLLLLPLLAFAWRKR